MAGWCLTWEDDMKKASYNIRGEVPDQKTHEQCIVVENKVNTSKKHCKHSREGVRLYLNERKCMLACSQTPSSDFQC